MLTVNVAKKVSATARQSLATAAAERMLVAVTSHHALVVIAAMAAAKNWCHLYATLACSCFA